MFCCSTKDIRRISFFAITILVLLRISIGWQFFYEGMWKRNSMRGNEPWSAAGYLKNAKGPFQKTFQNMVDTVEDPYDLDKLDQEKVVAKWKEWLEKFKSHYSLTDDQAKKIDALLAKKQADLKKVLTNPEWVGIPQDQRVGEFKLYQGMVERYTAKLEDVKQDFQQEHLDKLKSEMEAKRKELTGPVDTLTRELQFAATETLSFEQVKQRKMPSSTPKIDDINQKTIWVLLILGFCMMVGLFSRLAALGTAGMLLMFYLVVPPWPGVPEAPGPEHNFIINKNLIEMLACLALVFLPSGRWLGLDAFIHRFILRGKTD